ncbi:hypothetical protein QR680_018568 [Steinernema hermaphroditum]|uniref:Uncharacterized protein n=2 Tax=Steinernema hermaphroditum TaxID=289476 RepID=A0AA39HID3_9BILA|nr:hypothetical protein QR680_018568 [Steinernema hermaphroditum]
MWSKWSYSHSLKSLAMESVPLTFLDDVFAPLGYPTFEAIAKLDAAPWVSTARKFMERRCFYTVVMRPIGDSLDDLEYTLDCTSTRDDVTSNPSLEEVMTPANLRFCICDTLRLSEEAFEDHPDVEATWHRFSFDRFFGHILPRINFAHYKVESSLVFDDGLFAAKVLLRLMEENVFCSHVDLYYHERVGDVFAAFLEHQKKNEKLSELTLKGEWPPCILATIWEFIELKPVLWLDAFGIMYLFDSRILYHVREVAMKNEHVRAAYKILYDSTSNGKSLEEIDFLKKVEGKNNEWEMDCGEGKTGTVHLTNGDEDMYISVYF